MIKAMHGRVIKHGTYIPVSSESFDMPLPLNLELLHSNTLLCVYMISADKTVDFTYNANTDIPILTRTDRRLKIEDIYYLIRSRVFPDNPAVAPYELMRLGLHEYNPYEIIEITHGIMPTDSYWLRRGGEDIDFEAALHLFYNPIKPGSGRYSGGGIDDFLS